MKFCRSQLYKINILRRCWSLSCRFSQRNTLIDLTVIWLFTNFVRLKANIMSILLSQFSERNDSYKCSMSLCKRFVRWKIWISNWAIKIWFVLTTRHARHRNYFYIHLKYLKNRHFHKFREVVNDDHQ